MSVKFARGVFWGYLTPSWPGKARQRDLHRACTSGAAGSTTLVFDVFPKRGSQWL